MSNSKADIKLGYECNDHCLHCVVEELRSESFLNKKNLKTNEYKNEIIKCKNQGITHITVTGGEPTIRPDFLEILQFIKENNLKSTVQSNGRNFKNLSLAKNACEYTKDFVIALHGPLSEIHDKITQKKGSFEETILGIENLLKCNANVTGKIVLSIINEKHIFETIKLYKKLNIKTVVISFPHSSGAKDYIKNVAPYYKNIKEEIQKCLDTFNEPEKFHIILEDIMPCSLDKEYPVIHFYEFFQTFNKKRILKTLQDNYRDWNNLRKSIKRKNDNCLKCFFNNHCDGIWKEYVDERGFDEFKPVTKVNMKILFKYDAKKIQKIIETENYLKI